MARIRTIKPEFWGDEKLAPQTPIVRLVFLGLISMADDAGRLLDNLKSIDGMLFLETEDSSRESLDILARIGRIQRYESSSGQKIIQIVNWKRHQKVDKPAKYTLPGPLNGTPSATTTSENPRESLARQSRHPREKVARSSRSDLLPTTNDLRPTTNDRGPTSGADLDKGRASPPEPTAAAPPADPLVAAIADLPKGARDFLAHFYRKPATTERRRDVAQQLVDTLGAGARYKRGILVRAGSLERLDAKCREVVAEGMKDPDKAIRVLLDKLGDVSDLGPDGEGPGAQLQEDLRAQERDDLAYRATVDRELEEWSAEHPEEASRLRTAVLRDFKATREQDIAPLQRVMFDARLRHELVRAMRPERDPMRPLAAAEPHALEAHADTS